MIAEVITVGSELLLGETVDLHSSYLSRQMVPLGIEVIAHTSVGDDETRLREVLEVSVKRSSLVFLCGGLGPTQDDLTKETLADFLEIPLIQDETVKADLESYFKGRPGGIPPNNYKQTYVFQGGHVFHNDRGTAPGLAVWKDGVTYVLLPGPPGELRPMFENQVRPFLMRRFSGHHSIVSAPLSFFGIGESALEEKVKDLIQSYRNPVIATYAKEAGVVLRITAKAKDEVACAEQIRTVKNEILSRVGKYCYSEREETLEEMLVRALKELNQTVTVAESCTGGLLAELFTSVPGSSRVFRGGFVTYSNQAKKELLGVEEELLSEKGSVSPEIAESMAVHAQERLDTDFALSVTGIAGPDPVEGKPVGLVYIGLKERGQTPRVYEYHFKGNRRRIQLLAAKTACFILQQRIKER